MGRVQILSYSKIGRNFLYDTRYSIKYLEENFAILSFVNNQNELERKSCVS